MTFPALHLQTFHPAADVAAARARAEEARLGDLERAAREAAAAHQRRLAAIPLIEARNAELKKARDALMKRYQV